MAGEEVSLPPGALVPPWLSWPRPNGSPALARTASHIRQWLDGHGIPYETHGYEARPYFNEALGLWLMVMSLALFAAVLAGWGPAACAISLLFAAVGVSEVLLDWPVVSRLGRTRQQNIIVRISPGDGQTPTPLQEVVLSAHFDTKTEALDHDKRRVFTAMLAPAMALCLLVGFGALAVSVAGPVESVPQHPVRLTLVAGAAGVLFFGWGMGLNLATGRLLPRQSSGAVDNGGACTVLLEIARLLAAGELKLTRTVVIVALFSGEEVTMQGSRAFVRSRSWPLPTVALNLECLGQDGGYLTWDEDGTVLRRLPTAPPVNATLRLAVEKVTGQTVSRLPYSNTDAYAFLVAGLAAAGLGSSDRRYGVTGLHGPSDSPSRIAAERLEESVAILCEVLGELDSSSALSRR